MSAIGDHGSGTSTLPCTSWRKVSSSAHPVLQVARLDAAARRSHAAPSRTAVIVTTRYDHPLPCARLQVPEQAGVVAFGQRGHPSLAERMLERVLVVAGDLVGLVEEQHAGILARVRRQVPDACQTCRRSTEQTETSYSE